MSVVSTYYKEISNIPFRTFTLTEFGRWRNIFVVAKKNNFINLKFEDFMVIVYYQIALGNYEPALLFLDAYKTDDIQVTFLKSKLTVAIYGYSIILKDDIEFSLKKHEPSISNVASLTTIGRKTKPHMNDMLKKLAEIENIMSTTHFDPYYLPRIRNVIRSIESDTGMGPGKIIIMGIPIDSTLKYASAGSTYALIEIIHRIGHSKSPDINTAIRNDGPKITGLIKNKIMELDYKIIFWMFYIFQNHTLDEMDGLPIDLKYLIETCVDQVYKYILNGGDHIGLITGYLHFFAKTLIIFPPHYESICKPTLLNLYSKGFLPLFESNVCGKVFITIDMECVYKKWKVDDNLDIHMIGDTIENIFGCTEIYYRSLSKLERFSYNDKYTDVRLKTFFTILDIFPFWWKSAICVLGLNLFDAPNLQKQQEFLDFLTRGFYSNVRSIRNAPEFTGLQLGLLGNVHKGLIDLRENYKKTFKDDIETTKFAELDVTCQELKQKIDSEQLKLIYLTGFNCFDMVCIMRVTLDIYNFGRKYLKHLKNHAKYQPGGSHYAAIEESFSMRATSIITTQQTQN